MSVQILNNEINKTQIHIIISFINKDNLKPRYSIISVNSRSWNIPRYLEKLLKLLFVNHDDKPYDLRASSLHDFGAH